MIASPVPASVRFPDNEMVPAHSRKEAHIGIRGPKPAAWMTVDASGPVQVERHHVDQELGRVFVAHCPREEIELTNHSIFFTENPGELIRMPVQSDAEGEIEKSPGYSPDHHGWSLMGSVG
jgi:hypothetical protein